MLKISRRLVCLIACFIVTSLCAKEPAPTSSISHADAVVVFAKYFNLFDAYVDHDASVQECVNFFNQHGIYFKMSDVLVKAEFTKTDCARVMGQMELVFSGKATFFGGKVKLPKGVDHWQDFCILNDVKFIEGYVAIGELLLMVKPE